MIIFPAIDIKDGKVVRLLQGQFDKVTEYSHDPVTVAQGWVNKGAPWLHVIDLDGAKTGELKNFSVISQLAKSVNVPIQVGGGIRTEENIAQLIDAGVKRVILGTKVIEDRAFLTKILRKWQKQIAVSLDCVNGRVAQRGWTAVTNLKAKNFAQEIESLDVLHIIYTDIKRDGMLTGPNIDGLKEILDAVKISVIASGGISKIDDIKKLCDLKSPHLIGAITGKAIYEGTLDLTAAIKLCSQNG